MEHGTSDVMLMIRIFRHGVKRTIYLRLGVIQIRIFLITWVMRILYRIR